jgi:hypothetical protein
MTLYLIESECRTYEITHNIETARMILKSWSAEQRESDLDPAIEIWESETGMHRIIPIEPWE